ncbi:MAG: F0F1 ATP synthase subunit delta, partial [Gemmataceae bacterium]
MRTRLARVYAEALYTAATEQNALETVGAELTTVAGEIFAPGSSTAAFFQSPVVARKQKAALIQEAFTGKLSPL